MSLAIRKAKKPKATKTSVPLPQCDSCGPRGKVKYLGKYYDMSEFHCSRCKDYWVQQC